MSRVLAGCAVMCSFLPPRLKTLPSLALLQFISNPSPRTLTPSPVFHATQMRTQHPCSSIFAITARGRQHLAAIMHPPHDWQFVSILLFPGTHATQSLRTSCCESPHHNYKKITGVAVRKVRGTPSSALQPCCAVAARCCCHLCSLSGTCPDSKQILIIAFVAAEAAERP